MDSEIQRLAAEFDRENQEIKRRIAELQESYRKDAEREERTAAPANTDRGPGLDHAEVARQQQEARDRELVRKVELSGQGKATLTPEEWKRYSQLAGKAFREAGW